MRHICTAEENSCKIEIHSVHDDDPTRDFAVIVNGIRLKNPDGSGAVYETADEAWRAARSVTVS